MLFLSYLDTAVTRVLKFFKTQNKDLLTHWDQVTHICVSKLTIIGSENGLTPRRCQRHYLKQNAAIWLIRNKFQWNLKRNSHIFIQQNAFEHIVCEMAAILSQAQCFKPTESIPWLLMSPYSALFYIHNPLPWWHRADRWPYRDYTAHFTVNGGDWGLASWHLRGAKTANQYRNEKGLAPIWLLLVCKMKMSSETLCLVFFFTVNHVYRMKRLTSISPMLSLHFMLAIQYLRP